MDFCLLQRAFCYTQSFVECIAKGKTRTARFLYRNGARHDDCLIVAAKEGHLELVQFFSSAGIDVHAKNEAALRWAAQRGQLKVVSYLCEAGGADVHASNELALRVAAREGFLNVVRFLIHKGADHHAGQDLAFRWAAMNGHLHVVQFLFESYGVGHIGQALRWAAANGHLHIVIYLHQIGGANIQAENSAALRLAFRGGFIEVIKYLYRSINT